jgi:hypothetical protein
MVADGHPLVVGQQRLVGPEELAGIGGVENGCVEIRVVADGGGEEQRGAVLRDEAALNLRAQRLGTGVGPEQFA